MDDLFAQHSASLDALVNHEDKSTAPLEAAAKESDGDPIRDGVTPLSRPCEVCGDSNAPFGFNYPKAPKWYCRTHRLVGHVEVTPMLNKNKENGSNADHA